MYNKCCIVSCGSRRKDVNFYRFPSSEIGLQKWLHSINCERLRRLSVPDLHKQFVCQKHFESRFITSTKKRSRLKVCAFPTLFTAEEIMSGVPKATLIPKPSNLQSDHSYFKKRLHVDHSYCEIDLLRMPKYLKVMKPKKCYKGRRKVKSHCTSPATSYQSTITSSDTDTSEDSPPPTVSNENVAEYESSESQTLVKNEDLAFGRMTQDDELAEQFSVDESPDNEPAQTDESPGSDSHVGYKCNMCESDIRGFRYVCVQCADWDMCGACEARGRHSLHYVLRVPAPRPQSEIHYILEKIRREVLEFNILLDTSIKEENEEAADPLAEVVNSTEMEPPLDIEDRELNSSRFIEEIEYLSDFDEMSVTEDNSYSLRPRTLNVPSVEPSATSYSATSYGATKTSESRTTNISKSIIKPRVKSPNIKQYRFRNKNDNLKTYSKVKNS